MIAVAASAVIAIISNSRNHTLDANVPDINENNNEMEPATNTDSPDTNKEPNNNLKYQE